LRDKKVKYKFHLDKLFLNININNLFRCQKNCLTKHRWNYFIKTSSINFIYNGDEMFYKNTKSLGI